MQKRCPNCMLPMGRKRTCECGYNKVDENPLAGSLTGSVLNGRYTVGNIYNNATDSTVYVAFDEQFNNKVFIRQFTAEGMYENTPFEREIIVQRFINYQKTLAGVSLCKILPRTVELFVNDEKAYLVTEYFDGKPLKEHLETGFKFDSKTVKDIIKRLAKGLRVMHNSRIIYGNISPATVYILNDGKVKLFGIGSPFFSFIDDVDKKVQYLNPSYAAPELFKNAQRGSYCDVYSLGALYYRLITNTIPPISFLRSGGENLVPPNAINKKVKKPLNTALLNALNCPTQNRTQTMDAFLNEISAEVVKRRLGFGVVLANFLGLCQKVYFKNILPTAKKCWNWVKDVWQKAKKLPKVYYISGGALALLLVVVLAAILVWQGLGGGNTSSITWYYGTGQQSSETVSGTDVTDPETENTSSMLNWYDIGLTIDVVKCPKLTGLTVGEANKTLRDMYLSAGDVRYAFTLGTEKGRIISQEVASGTEVEIGKRINYVVSSGTIPQVAGQAMYAAQSTLKDAGFSNVNFKFTQSKNAVGTVVSVSAPKEIYKSTAITLNISGKKAVVPDFVGKTLADVYDNTGGVKIVTVNQSGNAISVSEGAYNAFVVVSQDSPAQMVTYEGMPVTLVVKLK